MLEEKCKLQGDPISEWNLKQLKIMINGPLYLEKEEKKEHLKEED